MATPRVPGNGDGDGDGDGGDGHDHDHDHEPGRTTLPCGETLDVHDLDLGMRAYRCACGGRHAVVLDVHPPSRFMPESIVEVLREAIEAADGFGPFGTPHLMGLVLEEFPESIVSLDAADDGRVGFSMAWVSDFDDRRLHEIVVELIVELMDHAVSHAEDDAVVEEFEQQLHAFDVSAFVDAYRAERDWVDERGPRR